MEQRIATAEWANPDEVGERYGFRHGMVWLGRSASERQVPLGYEDDRHVCLTGGTRGGKGTTSIVPALITWPGSVCVLDPKGENATITASRRGRGSQHCKGMGQTVKVLDPFQSAQVDDSLRGSFNPLDALDPKAEETIDEAGRIADAIVVIHEGGTNDPFWDESARAMVKGLLLHVLTSPQYEGRRNLVTLRKLITRGDWESVEALRAAGEKDLPPAHGLLWTGLSNNPAFDGLVAGSGDSFTNMLINSPKQYESVLQVANRNTEFIDSPAMQRLLGASDFQLSELKTRPEGLSLFLCLPQRYMSTHYRWLRMMIALIVTEMEKVRGQPATGHPILMVLDEFAGLKRMEVIETAVAQIAGYGVKMFFVLQSLEQLKAVYKDNWETFLANSGLKVFFNLEDNFSRDYVSKLIGETEVIRETRTASESVSESENVSRSTSRSKSESRGRSSSTGTSESEGTNSSVSSGKSWGTNESESKTWGASWGTNWAPGGFWGAAITGGNDGKSRTQSESRGTSRGWNEGRSDGVSHGTSRSRTDGTSETSGTGSSETEGTTRGTSQSRSSGMNETIQKRALVTPDEIGQIFARVKDRDRAAYPGLALVVISGARPVALRRVNYYEDYQFMGLFDPHPDHAFAPSLELCVEGRQLGFSLADFGLMIGGWSVKPGQVAGANDEAALVVGGSGLRAAAIRVPRAGLVATVPGDIQGPLFSLRYYEDGAALIDPFAELREFCNKVRANIAAKQRELADKKSSARFAVWVGGILAALIVLAMLFIQSAPAGMVLLLIGFGGIAVWMGIRASRLDAELREYGVTEAPANAPEESTQSPPPALADASPVLAAAGTEAAGPNARPALTSGPTRGRARAVVATCAILVALIVGIWIALSQGTEQRPYPDSEYRGAMLLLGFGEYGMTRAESTAKALKMMGEACDRGSVIACGDLGQRYLTGHEVPQDRARAAQFFSRACKGAPYESKDEFYKCPGDTEWH